MHGSQGGGQHGPQFQSIIALPSAGNPHVLSQGRTRDIFRNDKSIDPVDFQIHHGRDPGDIGPFQSQRLGAQTLPGIPITLPQVSAGSQQFKRDRITGAVMSQIDGGGSTRPEPALQNVPAYFGTQ